MASIVLAEAMRASGSTAFAAGVTRVDVTELTRTRADDVVPSCAPHSIAVSGLGF
jgi:hypothetical protein